MTASPRGRALLQLPILALLGWTVVLPLTAQNSRAQVLDRQAPLLGPGCRAGSPVGPGGPSASTGFEADGIDLLAWLPLNQLDPAATSGNDCWGYVSPSGREYALVGTSAGTSFVEITNPGLPVLVQNITGPTSLWRDIKTYDHYAYAVSEGGDGIQVIDLANIDSGTVTLVTTILGPGSSSSHNLGIDEVSGFLYRFGGGSEGMRVYDLQNPAAPAFVASWSGIYIHDAQVVTYQSGPLAGMQIMYACGGLNGGGTMTRLAILDVTTKSNVA
ncbi:MAG: choice-of-anchor B family protein, partial [Planctomycetota bacterium]